MDNDFLLLCCFLPCKSCIEKKWSFFMSLCSIFCLWFVLTLGKFPKVSPMGSPKKKQIANTVIYKHYTFFSTTICGPWLSFNVLPQFKKRCEITWKKLLVKVNYSFVYQTCYRDDRWITALPKKHARLIWDWRRLTLYPSYFS